LFHGFDPSFQMIKVNEFKEVLLALDSLPPEQTYVQILVNGLDAICHRHRDRPPIKSIAKGIYENVLLRLVDYLHQMGSTAIVYASADHGILWRPEPQVGKDFILVPDDRVHTHRYAKGTYLTPNTRHFTCYGQNYSVLAHPYLFRPLSNLEWGTHGGISYQESIVPFVKLEVS
jgi:hypothetical protein